MLDYGLRHRVVAVTGGGSGIGRATALALARDGAKVAVIDRDADRVDATVGECQALGAEAVGSQLDVTDEAATLLAAEEIERNLGPVYGLVGCAGIASPSMPAEKLDAADLDRVLAINTVGLFYTCRAFGARMIANGGGSIVAIGSVDSLMGHPGRLAYVTSKTAVVGLVRSLALEWGRHGVRVNTIAPGLVDTPLIEVNLPRNFIDEVMIDRTPMARMATAEDVAGSVLMLLSDAASFVTGTTIPVDGGLLAGNFTRRNGADLSSRSALAAGYYSED